MSWEHLALKASGAYFLESHGAARNRDLTFKGTYKISQALEPRAERLGQTYLLFLESLPEWHKAITARPGNTDTGNSHSGGSFTPWTLVLASVILESSL